MDRSGTDLQAMVPALLFLCAGVPLAALLDRLGFFDSIVAVIESRSDTVPLGALWVLAAATTAVLNLDTTVVLLTPIAIRLAQRSDADPVAVAAIPLVLASLASSFLPVSNLTTLIAVERLDLSVTDVVAHLALPGLVACTVGWFAYRRRHPTVLRPRADAAPTVDRGALVRGGAVVAGLIIGFVAGPAVGIAPWTVALAADVVLAILTRWVPWRDVPIATAGLVAAMAAVVAVVVPADLLASVLAADGPVAVAGTVVGGAGVANAINNLPALLLALGGVDQMTWGTWAWLLGVNTGAALLPLGALANLLWWRIARDEGVTVSVRSYARTTVPIVLPALLAAAVVLAVEAAIVGP